jgi:hypothetical protein
MDDYIPKPIDPAKFFTVMQAAVQEREERREERGEGRRRW